MRACQAYYFSYERSYLCRPFLKGTTRNLVRIRSTVSRIVVEPEDFERNLGRLLDWLHDGLPSSGPAECAPAVDVLETTGTVEVVADLPGVAPADLRILLRGDLLVVGGQKMPAHCEHPGATFHLAERSFGRFARVVRLPGPCDGGAARATLRAGELRIVLPRIEERRGGPIRVPVTTD